MSSDIDALKREGRQDEAAELLLARGDAAGAAQLFADAWKYDRAVRVALDAGLPAAAYRHSVLSRDRALIEPVLERLMLEPEGAREAVKVALGRGLTQDAARLAAAAGDHAEAARLYEEAGDLRAAAELAERSGDLKRAGRFYERHLADHEDDGAARLALGRILVRFGRTDHAVKHLQAVMQSAAEPPERQDAAGRMLIAAFDQLGMADAASSLLDTLRQRDASLPPTVRELLAREQPEREHQATPLLSGRYKVLRTIGAGGTGRVLLAEDTFFSRDVAIKVLSSVEGAKGRDALVRFAREARLSSGLEHPNVVKVLDYLPEGPYLVMEWMAGGTLEDRLSPTPADKSAGTMVGLPPGVVRHVLASVLKALDAAHRRGVVHRDVKPANVFFGAAGEVKLGDFGAAHLLDVGATRTGALVGTLAYMAPEQIASASTIHPATDLYATAVLAYAVVTGALPLPGPDFVEQHLSAPPRPLVDLAPPWLLAHPDALIALDDVLQKMLAKSPDERPESALAVLAALDRLPWDALERGYEGPVAPAAPATRTSVPPPAAEASGRFQPIGPAPLGVRARDELLQRDVELVTVDVQQRQSLLRFAGLFCPHVQAVYGLASSDPSAPIVLEAIDPPGVIDGAAVRAAVLALEGARLEHGSLATSLGTSAGRTVLRLPLGPPVERDRDALKRLGID